MNVRHVEIPVAARRAMPRPVPGTPPYGVLVKLERAGKHIRDAMKLASEYIKTTSIEIYIADNHETGYREWTVTDLALPPIPVELNLTIGDAVHNLRSALDHLMVQLVLCTGDDDTKAAKAMFPFSATKDSWGENRKKANGASKVARQRIDDLEPRGDGAGALLYELHQVDIADKHKLLLTTVVASSEVVLDLGTIFRQMAPHHVDVSNHPPMEVPIRNAKAVPIELGAVVFRSEPLGDTSHDNTRIRTDITLRLDDRGGGEPVISQLVAYDREVRDAVARFFDLLF